MVCVNIKKLSSSATIPTKGSDDSAGFDLYANIADCGSVVIAPGETQFIGTGIAMAIPHGYCGLIYARSGIACKRGLAPANKVGVIDSDYRGEFIVALHNHSHEAQTVAHGDRIAQLVISAVPNVTMCEASKLDDTGRGSGGFGHTGA